MVKQKDFAKQLFSLILVYIIFCSSYNHILKGNIPALPAVLAYVMVKLWALIY